MSKGILLVGEPMALFIAQNEDLLENVDNFSVAVAGAEFNVAVGMTRLSHKVGYMTALGNDPFGKRIVTSMKAIGIDTSLISYNNSLPTGFMLKSKVKSGDPLVFYFRKGSAASALDKNAVDKVDLSSYSNLHITGILPALSKSCLDATKALMIRSKKAGLTISFDPNLRPALWESKDKMVETTNELASLSDIVLPGINEGKVLMGSSDPKKIAEFYLGLKVKTVVVKLGCDGAYAATKNEQVTVKGFEVKDVIDTVGAGDGFAVGVLSALMENKPLEEALLRGNAIGALQVMSVGDNEGLPTREKLAEFMELPNL